MNWLQFATLSGKILEIGTKFPDPCTGAQRRGFAPSRDRHDAADRVVKAPGDGSRDTGRQISMSQNLVPDTIRALGSSRRPPFPSAHSSMAIRPFQFEGRLSSHHPVVHEVKLGVRRPSSDCVSSTWIILSPLVPCLIFFWNMFFLGFLMGVRLLDLDCVHSMLHVCGTSCVILRREEDWEQPPKF